MIETPAFLVVSTSGKVELRAYSPYIVAEVEVQATNLRRAAEAGFRPLAAYIFGGNVPQDKIAMTAPVTAEAEGEKISMTAPVTSSVDADGTYTVRFSMPPKWTMDTLPAPKDPGVRLVEVDAHHVLAIKYRGQSDGKRMASGAEQLLSHAAENGFIPEGEPTWAGYSAPYVPVPLRKWEMLLQVRRP